MHSAAKVFGILAFIVVITPHCLAEDPPAKKPSVAAIRNWVSQLGAPNFETREQALESLIEAGRPAIAPLADAVLSADPEVAWRAATALEAIGLGGDEATLGEIKVRMEKTKGTPHRDLAMVLSTLSQRWNQMQQFKAQSELTRLGATFPGANNPAYVSTYGGGPIYYSGGFAPATFSSRTILLDSLSSTVPVIAAPAKVVEFDPLTLPSSLERIVKDLEDTKEAAEESKESKAKVAELGMLAKEIARRLETRDKEEEKTAKEEKKTKEDEKVAVEAKKAARDKDSKVAEEKDSKEKSKSESDEKSEKPAEAVASAPAVTFSVGELDVAPVAVDYSFITPTVMGSAIGEPTPYEGGGVIRLDKEWRGGDRGLAHLAGLANVSMLDIHDAPISDKAIEYIKKMPALNSIMIRGTKMTPESLMKLVKEKPGLQVRGQSRGILGVNAGETDGPALVSAPREGGPAAGAGVIAGDLITKLDGKEVTTFGHLTLLMMKKEPGDEVTLTIKRGEEILEKKLKLAPREPATP